MKRDFYSVWMTWCLLAAMLLCGAGHIPLASGAEAGNDPLLSLGIEDLMNVTVTSASKREEKYVATAAATYIITGDDIRRSGARSIPEALRLAPGLDVQKLNANLYGIAARGQNDIYSDKLLVMVDGRTVYSPTFSGVWWQMQNYPLEDIDRIEVIRGPGGAVWGVNAVNGIINIITKSADKTEGVFLNAGGGSEEKGFGSVRVGGRNGNARFRAYAMAEERDGGVLANGADTPDYRRFGQGGFRLDWQKSALTNVSLHGDIYDVKAGSFGQTAINRGIAMSPFTNQNRYKGYNTVLKVKHELMPAIDITAQAFFDHQEIDHFFFGENRNTGDIDIQFDTTRLPRQTISFGSNMRLSHNSMTCPDTLCIAGGPLNSYSLFINDSIELWRNRLNLILGTKLERNSYSPGWQNQPTARVIYTDDHWSAWAAVSKAIRLPNQTETNMTFDARTGTGFVGRVIGDGRARPERMTSYEAGWRFFPDRKLLVQLALFEYRYRGVIDVLSNVVPPFPEGAYTVFPVYLTNVLDGEVRGGEVDVTWRINRWLEVSGWLNYLHQGYRPTPVVNADSLYTAYSVSKQSPTLRYRTAISLNPTPDIDVDLNHYAWQTYREKNLVHEHHRLDLRLAWRPRDGIELSLVGQDLLKRKHNEDINNYLENASFSQQAFYAGITIRH